jgi:hypothetical protein
MDQGMDVVGELQQLTALDLSSLFNATGESRFTAGFGLS